MSNNYMEQEGRNLKIGIDLDQVVTNAFENVVRSFNLRYGTQLSLEDIEHHYYLEEVDIGNREERISFLRKTYSDESIVFHQANPIGNSPEITRKLVTDGHQIHFISSREPHLVQRTVEWLASYGYPATHQNVHLRYSAELDGVSYKIEKANELGIDVVVEDDERIAARSPIPVILFDYAWNRGIERNGVFRVRNWDQIYQVINRLSGRSR